MCSLGKLAPTLPLCLLLVACSSSSKEGSKDAGGSSDGGSTALDSGKKMDVRDSATLTEAGGRLDVPSAIDASKVGDAKDAASPTEAGTSSDGRDAADAKKTGDAKDAPVGSDAGLDSAIDVYLPNSCQNPIVIPLDNSHVDLTVSTDGESHDFELPCATGGSDIVLSFYLDRPEMVYADTFGTGWNTILALSPTCPLTEPQATEGMVTCNDDACDSTQSQVFAILPSGRHYLVLSGSNDESGTTTLHFQHAPVGIGNSFNMPPGTGTLTGTLSGIGRLGACEAVGPEQSYWWVSCPDYAGGNFRASTCKSADLKLDVILFLQTPRNDALVCANGDSCGLQESMTATVPAGAGINSLAVEANNGSGHNTGDYTLDYTRP
jgi:hypothetical protein